MASAFANDPSIRVAGVALPLFSLRERDDMGSGTILDLIPFIDWSVRNGLRLIQLLPLNEAAPEEGSPYKALSAFAIDPSYIAVKQVPDVVDSSVAQAWLARPKVQERLDVLRRQPTRNRKLSYGMHVRLLEFAFAAFEAGAEPGRVAAFEAFAREQSPWLDDYALFRAIGERHAFADWENWPAVWRAYETAQASVAVEGLAARVRFAKYIQWLAWEQWQQVRAHARHRGVLLKGDVSFVCAGNSADAWAHPEWFDLRSSAGTPPDAFSETGQLWELPVYDWEAMRRSDYAWWRRRARQAGELYDVFRVDHVVGLYRTYAINLREGGPSGFVPADEDTQRRQGHELLQRVQQEAGDSQVVAEDLGTIPDWVRQSLNELCIPGYKVFRWEQHDGGFIDPRQYPYLSIATTGTHDTDGLLEWWDGITTAERDDVCTRLGVEASATLPWQPLLQRLLDSPPMMAIFPLQDLLGWRDRINVPATVGPHNWSYRLNGPLTDLEHDSDSAGRLKSIRQMIVASGRTR